MRTWLLIPIGAIALVLVALPVAALTETGPEHELKEWLGVDLDGCEPKTNLASAWETQAAIPFEIDEPRGVGLDGNVYLVGGISGLRGDDEEDFTLEASDQLTRFDPRSERFQSLTPMPRRLNHIGVVAHGGDLYVLGGYGRTLGEDTSRAFYRYDPASDRWSRLPDMPEPKAAMAAGVVGDRLIVAGGARDNVPVSSTYGFDFDSNRWSRLPDMPDRREHVGSATLGDALYVLGGRTASSSAIDLASRFDTRRDRWKPLPPMPIPTGGLGAVALDGRVFAVGGGNDRAGTVTGAVQEFDPRTERWSLRAAMRTPRHGHEVAATEGTIWAIGGSPCAYFNASDIVESLRIERRSEAS